MQQLLFLSKRQRATSMQDPSDQNQKLPNILTPTFGDWKIMGDSRPHPKISRRNPLFNKFGILPKKATTPCAHTPHNQNIFRDLRSEEQSQRTSFKDNLQDRISTTETAKQRAQSQPRSELLLSECQYLFENQKKVFETILKQNSLYNKYQRVIDKEQQATNQKIVQIFNQYK